jgi:uncharacterized protein YciI
MKANESMRHPYNYYVVIRERGLAWNWNVPMRRQEKWTEHAAYMDELAESGFIVAGGPLGDENKAKRVLHIVNASDERAIKSRLSEDPWTGMRLLVTISIDPWTVLLGNLA